MVEQIKEPKYFQVQAVDNFFDKPEEIVKFANQLEYQVGPYGFWPGKRTKELHIDHKNFFNSFLEKIFSLFFNFTKDSGLSWSNVVCIFKKLQHLILKIRIIF